MSWVEKVDCHLYWAVLKRVLAIASVLALPVSALAQGPIFLTSPNTMPPSDVAPSISYARQGDETDLNLQAYYGIHPKVSLGLGFLMVGEADGPLALGRVQTQVKLRLLQKTGDGKRTVVGFTTGIGLPVGDGVDRVARASGVSNLVGSLTASHVERRTGIFAGAQATMDVYDTGYRPTGTVGIAGSWRFKPAPPGATSGPGFTLFTETLGHYEGNHSGWFALAPGLMYRTGRTQIKMGARIPVHRWNSHSSPVISIGTSMFIPVKSSHQ